MENFALFETKRLQPTILNLMKMAEFSKNIENTLEKEIAPYEQFLLFPLFTKDLYCRHLKRRACLQKG